MNHQVSTVVLVTALLLPSMVNAGAAPEDLDSTSAQSDVVPIRVAADRNVRSADASTEQSPSIPSIFQFYASDKSAEMQYEQLGSVFGLGNSRANASFLFSEERDNAISGSLMFDAQPEFLSGLDISFGLKAFAGLLAIENTDVFGLGANLGASYLFPVKQFPLRLSAELGYVPDILTFGEADRLFDWHVRAGLPMTETIFAFVGLRYLQFDTRPGDRELDNQVHVGFRWNLNAR